MQKGFTLAELAIVMAIIGLLVGGVLQGSEMLRNSRVNATVSQVKAYEAAMRIFRDKYAGLPGDSYAAAMRIPGCGANCRPLMAGSGNNIIGLPGWGANWATQAVSPMPLPPNSEKDETALFWLHLVMADMITGSTNAALLGEPVAWGVTHPYTPVGGGFVVGFADGASVPPGNSFQNCGNGNNGNGGNCRSYAWSHGSAVLALLPLPTASPATITAGSQMLSPQIAARIDRKIDDGISTDGQVLAFGTATSCFSTVSAGGGNGQGQGQGQGQQGQQGQQAATTMINYSESATGNDCGLFFVLGQ